MFVLAQITDTIEVQPHQFKQELKAIQNAILIKYRDRILPSVGLCITLHSIVSLGDAFVFPGEGSAHYRVTFKLVRTGTSHLQKNKKKPKLTSRGGRQIAFKPFRGEIITGKVRACSEDGIYVSLGFFEDVFIPATELQVPSTFQTSEQLWVWTYESESEDGTVEGENALSFFTALSFSDLFLDD